jgi:hypothetical protein
MWTLNDGKPSATIKKYASSYGPIEGTLFINRISGKFIEYWPTDKGKSHVIIKGHCTPAKRLF